LVSLRVVGPAAEQSIPYLTKLLHGGDAKEIKAALRVIESIGPRAESLRSELLSQLHVSDRENRKAAIAAVATVFPNGDPEIVDALASTLDAESEDVVESSIIALEVMGPGAEAALPELRKQFDHPGYGIAAQAAIAAWKIGEDPKTVLPVLLRKLKDPDQSYLAAVALGMMGKDAAPAVNSLIALLDAEKLQIRISAVQALGKIGPHASAVATAALAGHAELEQDRHVASYAVSLWQIDRNADQCLPLIKRGLLAADASDKLQLLQIVTKIGPAAAELRPLLKSLQNDFNPEVSEAASVAASALKDHR
jgi:HEAT repeat protein